MSVKNCMRELAKHAYPAMFRAEFKMHNSPIQQLLCLNSGGKMHTGSGENLGKACEAWYVCLGKKERRGQIKDVLMAMLPPNVQDGYLLQSLRYRAARRRPRRMSRRSQLT